MGLSLNLSKKNNHLYCDFIDAYWSIEDINYTTTEISCWLRAYASRESKYSKNQKVESLVVGAGSFPYVDACLYHWQFSTYIKNIFPNGIPLDENEQKAVIYNYIKSYTGLPFTDVFESENSTGEEI